MYKIELLLQEGDLASKKTWQLSLFQHFGMVSIPSIMLCSFSVLSLMNYLKKYIKAKSFSILFHILSVESFLGNID